MLFCTSVYVRVYCDAMCVYMYKMCVCGIVMLQVVVLKGERRMNGKNKGRPLMPREIADGWEERESNINQQWVMIDMRLGMD